MQQFLGKELGHPVDLESVRTLYNNPEDPTNENTELRIRHFVEKITHSAPASSASEPGANGLDKKIVTDIAPD